MNDLQLRPGVADWPKIDAIRRSVRVMEWGQVFETTIAWDADADIPCVIEMRPKLREATHGMRICSTCDKVTIGMFMVAATDYLDEYYRCNECHTTMRLGRAIDPVEIAAKMAAKLAE